jgi:hypothetical protein
MFSVALSVVPPGGTPPISGALYPVKFGLSSHSHSCRKWAITHSASGILLSDLKPLKKTNPVTKSVKQVEYLNRIWLITVGFDQLLKRSES